MHHHKTSEGFFDKQKLYNQNNLNKSDIMINPSNTDKHQKALSLTSISKVLNKSSSAERSFKTIQCKLIESKTPTQSAYNINFSQNNNMKNKNVNTHQNYKQIHKKINGMRSKSGTRGGFPFNNSSTNILNDFKLNKDQSYISTLNISSISNNYDKGNQNITGTSSKRIKKSTEKIKENIDNSVRITKNESTSNLNLTFLQDLNDQPNDKHFQELVHRFQLRDAIHRQEINKLKGSNELLRSHIISLEEEVKKFTKSRVNVKFV